MNTDRSGGDCSFAAIAHVVYVVGVATIAAECNVVGVDDASLLFTTGYNWFGELKFGNDSTFADECTFATTAEAVRPNRMFG